MLTKKDYNLELSHQETWCIDLTKLRSHILPFGQLSILMDVGPGTRHIFHNSAGTWNDIEYELADEHWIWNFRHACNMDNTDVEPTIDMGKCYNNYLATYLISGVISAISMAGVGGWLAVGNISKCEFELYLTRLLQFCSISVIY